MVQSAASAAYEYNADNRATGAAKGRGLPSALTLTDVDEELMSEVLHDHAVTTDALASSGALARPDAECWAGTPSTPTSRTAAAATDVATNVRSLRTRSRTLARTMSALKSAAETRYEAHHKSTKLDQLFQSYDSYWEIVGLAQALCGTMAVVIVSANEDLELGADGEGPSKRQQVLASAYACSFGLAFITSMAGVSLCVLNKVQFGFAIDKGAFMKRYARWMEFPSALLIMSGATLMAGVCARVFALYERWVAVLVVSLASVIFPALLLLRRSMKRFVADQLTDSRRTQEAWAMPIMRTAPLAGC